MAERLETPHRHRTRRPRARPAANTCPAPARRRRGRPRDAKATEARSSSRAARRRRRSGAHTHAARASPVPRARPRRSGDAAPIPASSSTRRRARSTPRTSPDRRSSGAPRRARPRDSTRGCATRARAAARGARPGTPATPAGSWWRSSSSPAVCSHILLGRVGTIDPPQREVSGDGVREALQTTLQRPLLPRRQIRVGGHPQPVQAGGLPATPEENVALARIAAGSSRPHLHDLPVAELDHFGAALPSAHTVTLSRTRDEPSARRGSRRPACRTPAAPDHAHARDAAPASARRERPTPAAPTPAPRHRPGGPGPASGATRARRNATHEVR